MAKKRTPKVPKGVEVREGKDGAVSYRVRWRDGGRRNGSGHSRTFTDADDASRFREALVANGYHDPYRDPAWAEWLGVRPVVDVPEETARPLTVGELAEEYLEFMQGRRERRKVDGRTVAEVRRDLEAHVLPAVVELPGGRRVGPLRQLPITSVNADVVNAWISWMGSRTYGKSKPRPYSPKTIKNVHGSCLAPVFAYAVEKGHLTRNPARGKSVELPEMRGRTVTAEHVVQTSDMADWIVCAYDVDTDTGDITAVILGTGLRWGEVTALRPRDVRIARDDAGEVTGGRITLSQVVKEDENRKPYIATIDDSDGKTRSAHRTFSIGRPLAGIIDRRAAERDPDALLFGAPGNRGGIIWRSANFHSWRWSKVRALAAERGLAGDPSPHRLRHSHATALIDAHGLDAVSKRLGHASTRVTSRVYSHLTTERDDALAGALDVYMVDALARVKSPAPEADAEIS